MTNAPTDALFKAIFGQPEHAAVELRHILRGHLAARINGSTLTPQPGSYVDEELAGQHSDLLFSATASPSHGPVLVYVLFEHQSSAQTRMALRLLRYVVRIWERHANEHAEAPLPLIIPAVLAQVPGGWTAPTQFADLFSASITDIAPGVLPGFQYAGISPRLSVRCGRPPSFGRQRLACPSWPTGQRGAAFPVAVRPLHFRAAAHGLRPGHDIPATVDDVPGRDGVGGLRRRSLRTDGAPS